MANEKRLIDADELVECIKERLKNDTIIRWLCCIVNETPTVDAVEVVHGRWVAHHSHLYECTCCHAKYITMRAKDWNYCPNCGAKMDGDGNA